MTSPFHAPRHVLITGAAGSIGAALARAMRRAWPQTRLALVDRSTDALAAIVDELGDASAHAIDLRDLDALPGRVEAIGPVDGLVNCAGVMIVQQVHTWSWETARELLAVDLLAPLRLQDLVVRGMVATRRGMIVNIASMAGKVPLKGCAYYGASKAGLAMASEVARAELAPHGIRVVTVYPGLVRSNLEHDARRGWGGGGRFSRIAPVGDPAELARRVVEAVARDEARVIYPRTYAFGWSMTPIAQWIALSYGPDAVH